LLLSRPSTIVLDCLPCTARSPSGARWPGRTGDHGGLIFQTPKGGREMKHALGRHILCEAYGCDPEVLSGRKVVEQIMVDAALMAGAEVREVAFHKFSPQGVSGVVVISESHLAIHTWPELGYAAIDVFTCGDTVDPWEACNYLIK